MTGMNVANGTLQRPWLTSCGVPPSNGTYKERAFSGRMGDRQAGCPLVCLPGWSPWMPWDLSPFLTVPPPMCLGAWWCCSL